jgi:hypothetical protein
MTFAALKISLFWRDISNHDLQVPPSVRAHGRMPAMALCPICNTPGAYIGFSSIECRNPDCEHFVIFEEEICPCCGQAGHNPDLHSLNGGDPASNSDPNGTVYLDSSDPSFEPAPTSQDASSIAYDGAQP